jgi:hypothetical protein
MGAVTLQYVSAHFVSLSITALAHGDAWTAEGVTARGERIFRYRLTLPELLADLDAWASHKDAERVAAVVRATEA